MEGYLRKRISLSSWMVASMLALGMNGIVGQELVGATYNDARTTLSSGVYGTADPATGNSLKLDVTPQPGDYADPGMSRTEDLYQFTGTNFNLGSGGGTTIVGWKTSFGTRGKGDDVTMSLVGGTNIFDNQGIYIGSRSGENGLGGDTTLNMQGGTNIFTQRVIVGGEGQNSSSVLTGKSNINISGGVNIFTYDKKFDWSQKVSVAGKTYKIADYMGGYSKYLGNGYTAGTVSAAPEFCYDSVNAYNYYNNYYGVFFSAMAAKGAAGSGADGGNTQGVNLNISGGVNIFNVATYVGGGYDLNPYGSVNTSADDNDVVWGGTNNINISGGFTNFAARTYFGAAGSSTTVNFTGRGTTYLTGAVISEDMDKALAEITLDPYGEVEKYQNSYNGGDLPYIFFGGKDITDLDTVLARNGNIPEMDSTTVVNVNGFNSNMTTLDVQTTAFFGGADERWLAGDQYYIDAEGNVAWNFEYGEEDVESVAGTEYEGTVVKGGNATRVDSGKAIVNLNSGKIRIGNVNTTEIVATRNKENWNYKTTEPYGVVYEPLTYQKRYEQVRLIGAAAGSTFNANGGRLQFDVSLHLDNADAIQAAAESGYSGYFVDMPNTVTVNGQNYLTLETGMIAFDSIHISSAADLTLTGIGNLSARADVADDSLTGQHEFYTNTMFVDTTDAAFDETGTTVLLDQSSTNTNSTFEKTKYEKWFYTTELQDVSETYAASEGIQTNQVRAYVKTKSLDEALIGNMKRNSDTFRQVLLTGKGSAYEPVYDALEQIIATSETREDALQNFDQLVGTAYGNMAAAQVRRISSFNTMMADQIIASDVCLDNLRGQRCGNYDACGNCKSWTAWGNFYADGGRVGINNDISGYDTDTYGGMFAIDWNNCESCHFGVFFNYAKTNVGSEAPMGYTHLESDDYSVGLYAKWLGLMCTGGYGTLVANVTFSDIASTRELYLDDYFSGDTDAVLPSVFYERGWVFFPSDLCSINPFFGLQYVYYNSNDFSEHGADEVGDPSALALNVSDIEHNSLRTLVGTRISKDWMFGYNHDRRLTTRLKGAWMHDLLGECDPTFSTSHACSPDFPVWNVRANNAGRDWAILGAGLDFDASQRLSFLFDYNCYVNEYTTIHSGMATMRFNF